MLTVSSVKPGTIIFLWKKYLVFAFAIVVFKCILPDWVDHLIISNKCIKFNDKSLTIVPIRKNGF